MLKAAVAVNFVSQALDCRRQTIHKFVTHYAHTGTVRDRQLPGRPHAMTARTDRFIMLTHLRHFFFFLPATVSAICSNDP